MYAGALVGQERILKSLESGEVVSCMMSVVGGNQTQVFFRSIGFTPANPQCPLPRSLFTKTFQKLIHLRKNIEKMTQRVLT